MIIKRTLDLMESIDECRQNMYELAQKRDLSDPEMIDISQQSDIKIAIFQNIIYKIPIFPIEINELFSYK
ncbi:aspartyl-phosphate phosphatase Spo0E family protein [Priestia flexa]|uniref:aspartyl-phosphate phosphatase Spo0E family protein n=1 Tax=Priestia flexa TaxID=86664 RepID=UPI001B344FFA|nr:aspartyl-phosphate phosphatase Spo0E family protein [Priestia flexa]